MDDNTKTRAAAEDSLLRAVPPLWVAKRTGDAIDDYTQRAADRIKSYVRSNPSQPPASSYRRYGPQQPVRKSRAKSR